MFFRYTFLTVFSPSKNFQKPKNVGQLDLQIVSTCRTFLLINWYLVLKQPNYSFLILTKFKISISGCFITDNSFNKQNSHTVALKIKRLSSHSEPYYFPSFTMLVSILTLNNILNRYHISLTNKLSQLTTVIFFRNKGRSDYQNEEKSTNRTIMDFLHVFFKQRMT